jgi:holo-[acyl-carrier protein] synthase
MIGIGVDVVDIERFADASPSLLARLFTTQEREYAQRFTNYAPAFAARFAAKEATMKALGVGIGAFEFHDVEVIKLASGAPQLAVTGTAAQLAKDMGISSWLVTLSHSRTVATAVVVAQ